MNTGKALLGMMAFMGMGVAVGILFSPEKGKTTRKKLLKKGSQYKKGIKELVESGKHELEKISDDIVDMAAKEVKKAKKLINI